MCNEPNANSVLKEGMRNYFHIDIHSNFCHLDIPSMCLGKVQGLHGD